MASSRRTMTKKEKKHWKLIMYLEGANRHFMKWRWDDERVERKMTWQHSCIAQFTHISSLHMIIPNCTLFYLFALYDVYCYRSLRIIRFMLHLHVSKWYDAIFPFPMNFVLVSLPECAVGAYSRMWYANVIQNNTIQMTVHMLRANEKLKS